MSPRSHWSLGMGLAVLLLAAAALLLAPMLAYLFGRDQGVFACGAEVLARGGVLYRDLWDVKPPGIHYLYWLSFIAFGRSMLAPRLLDLLWTLATAGGLLVLSRRLAAPLWAAVAGAFLFLIRYALGFDYWHTAQGDGFASLPLTLAALSLLGAERRRSWWLAAGCGALVGAAIIIKFTLAVFLALPLIAVLVAREERWPARLLRAAGYAFGCLVVIALVAASFWKAGALKDMVEILFMWNARYATIRSPYPVAYVIIRQTLRFLFGGQYLVLKLIGLLGVIGLADLVVRRRAAPYWWLAPAWFGAMLVQVWAQGKYYEYHWLPVLPPLGLLAGQGMAAAWRLLRARAPTPTLARAAAGIGLALLLVCCGFGYWAQFAPEIRYATGALPAADFAGLFYDRTDFSLSADLQVASFLKSHTSPHTPIFIWGFEPVIYFLADRPPASRFISQHPLVTPWSPPAWRQELIRDLTARPPAYVLVVHDDVMPWMTMRPYDSATELAYYPELAGLLNSSYRPVGRIEDFDIWGRAG